jgi:mono/diheme cytochrome c family protein
MFDLKPLAGKLLLALVIIFSISVHNTVSAQGADATAGKALFISKCASCHNVFKDGTGPALKGLESRHTWADHNELLRWVHNPPAYIGSDKTGYTPGLVAQFKTMMSAFPDLTIKDVDNIVAHINNEVTLAETKPKDTGTADAGKKDNSNAIIFGVISLILAVIALILMQVNSNLKKMSDDAEGIRRPEPVPFYRNKVYIAMLALILFAVGGYYVSKGAINLGRQKGYQPVQPIYYSAQRNFANISYRSY